MRFYVPLGNYVRKAGDVMTGNLTVPRIVLSDNRIGVPGELYVLNSDFTAYRPVIGRRFAFGAAPVAMWASAEKEYEKEVIIDAILWGLGVG